MRNQERENWIAQLEAERAERTKDRVAHLELADVVAKEHIDERERWSTEREKLLARLGQEAELARLEREKLHEHFQQQLAGARVESTKLLAQLAEQLAAAQEERIKLLDRIQHPEVRQVNVSNGHDEDWEPPPAPEMPPDMEELAHVGGIVPEGVNVGLGDEAYPPPVYPQTPFAGSED